jgi:hypothetical protein
MTTNGKPTINPQAVRWHSEFGPPVHRKVSRPRYPQTNWAERLVLLGMLVMFAAVAACVVVVIGGLLYLGAQLVKGLLSA